MPIMNYSILIFIFLLQYAIDLSSQNILPYFENYSKKEYKGDNQVWSLAQGDDSALYFANNRYLLRYNGVRWEKYTLPHKTIIRSVFAFDGKVYAGSLNEFGYWTRNNGIMVYHSLIKSDSLFDDNSKNEEIWKIFEFNNALYFQGFNKLFRKDEERISEIRLPGLISYCFSFKNRLFAATIKKGIYQWIDTAFVSVDRYINLSGNVIHGMGLYHDHLYIFTQKNGVFVDNGQTIERWNNPLNSSLIKEMIITANFIDNSKLAIGTASNGFYFVDMNSGEFLNINKTVGLNNNSVLSIGVDKENDIWLGLDNGIAHIEINSPYRLYSDKSGVLGSVYSLSQHNEDILLGSNHGLFVLTDSYLKSIEQSKGQVWNVFRIENKFIIGHNDGTFMFENQEFTKLNDFTGGWNMKKDKYHNRYIQANYTGIVFYDNTNVIKGKRLDMHPIPVKDFCQISENTIIAAFSNKGLAKIVYNDSLKLLSTDNLTKKKGIVNDYGIKIFEYKDNPLFYIDNSWYYYDPIASIIVEYPLFNKHFSNINEIFYINDSSFVVVKNDMLYFIKEMDGQFPWTLIPPKYYEGKLINNETKVFKFKDKYLVNLDDGFFMFNEVLKDNYPPNVHVELFYDGKLLKSNAKIPNNANIEVDLVSGYYGNKKFRGAYRIDDEAIKPLIQDRLIINNLRGGKHTIDFFYADGNGYKYLKSILLRVKQPWFLSFIMFVVYVLFLAGVFWIYLKWNKNRFNAQLKLKEKELEYKNELIHLEMQAKDLHHKEEYEKLLLKNQVQSKTNELAEKSLNLAKQMDLFNRVQEIIQNENNPQALKKKINDLLKTFRFNKNEWKAFEDNLFKSNQGFIEKLNARYSNLTSKDIKLAIYLRMNLTSKEIAPLMNISYRSIELHRYRLRKKMNLDSGTNLNVFMSQLK